MHVVGGATQGSSLMNAGLIDELQLLVNPIFLGGGKALFKDAKERRALKLVRTKPLKSGRSDWHTPRIRHERRSVREER